MGFWDFTLFEIGILEIRCETMPLNPSEIGTLGFHPFEMGIPGFHPFSN